MVQWLRLRAPTAGGTGSIPGWGRSGMLHSVAKKKKKTIKKIKTYYTFFTDAMSSLTSQLSRIIFLKQLFSSLIIVSDSYAL